MPNNVNNTESCEDDTVSSHTNFHNTAPRKNWAHCNAVALINSLAGIVEVNTAPRQNWTHCDAIALINGLAVNPATSDIILCIASVNLRSEPLPDVWIRLAREMLNCYGDDYECAGKKIAIAVAQATLQSIFRTHH